VEVAGEGGRRVRARGPRAPRPGRSSGRPRAAGRQLWCLVDESKCGGVLEYYVHSNMYGIWHFDIQL
jgi:hypothetical protein